MANIIIYSKDNLFYCLHLLHHILFTYTCHTQCDVCSWMYRYVVKKTKAVKQVVLTAHNIISHLKMYVHLTERYMYT